MAIFSIAMGFLEAAVVIYLRKLYYAEGFKFPLTMIPPDVALVEFMREAATLVMLISIGVVAGKNNFDRFLCFIFCFGVWDLAYYAGLKLFLDWPASFMDWDILFLIPVPWVGPVIAPCIVSLTMIIIACIFVGNKYRFKKPNMFFMIAGSIVIIYSFCEDYVKLIMSKGYQCWTPGSGKALFSEINDYVPSHYDWMTFLFGELLILFAAWQSMRKSARIIYS